MTKLEFLDRLKNELIRKNVSDTTEIIEEYEQHFAFKLADGHSEEEIAAKLGDPKGIAAQYDASTTESNRGKRAIVTAGLGVADFFFGILCVILIAWEIVMATLALACGSAAVGLIGNFERLAMISAVHMPYHCAFIFGLIFLSLAVLAVIAEIYFFELIRQLMCAFGRFHKNMLASASGKGALPSITVYPQFSTRTRRALKKISLIAVIAFVVCFVVGFVVCTLSAGAIEFWHAWGWFQNV